MQNTIFSSYDFGVKYDPYMAVFLRFTCSWGWGWKRKNLPVFLAEPCTPVPVAAPGVPGLPGTPVFLLSRLLKKLASTPSFAAAPINTHNLNNELRCHWGYPTDIHLPCVVFKSKHTSRFTITTTIIIILIIIKRA